MTASEIAYWKAPAEEVQTSKTKTKVEETEEDNGYEAVWRSVGRTGGCSMINDNSHRTNDHKLGSRCDEIP